MNENENDNDKCYYRVFSSRTQPSQLMTSIKNCCRKHQYTFKQRRKNFAAVNFLVSVPWKFSFFSSCISYGVKKETNIAANKNYWHSNKFLSLFICWLFSVTWWNMLSHSKLFFSQQKKPKKQNVFFFFSCFTY